MAARRTHDVVATVGKYKDQSGEEKKRYITVGSAFTDEEGRISIKLDACPVSPEWSGWLSLYPVENRPRQQQAPQRQQPAPKPRPAAPPRDDDDIPF